MMGGKNPMVILDDADLDTAVSASVNGAFFSTGQRCTACSRLIATERIYGAFGGRKGSSYGPREQGSYAAEFYTVVKTAYIAP